MTTEAPCCTLSDPFRPDSGVQTGCGADQLGVAASVGRLGRCPSIASAVVQDGRKPEAHPRAAAPPRARRAVGVEFALVDARSAMARSALGRYFAELDERFPDGFDPEAGGAAAVDAMSPPRGAFGLLRSAGTTVGCGGVQGIGDTTAEIKRMWIDPDWRGLGLGRRLLAHLEATAAELGRRRVVLDTNETLREAIAMYESAGYHPVSPYNDNPYAHRWFAKDL